MSGWIPSFKTGATSHVRQPFCSQLEERLLLWLEYHPQVASYARIAVVLDKGSRVGIGEKERDGEHEYGFDLSWGVAMDEHVALPK